MPCHNHTHTIKHTQTIDISLSDERDTPWKFYNHLIGKIPEDIEVKACCLGTHWSYLEAECGMGVSFTTRGGAPRLFTGDVVGMKVRDVAKLAKSWNFIEATIGVAALNAYYAQPEKLEALGAIWEEYTIAADGKPHKSDVFEIYRDRVVDKKVCVIGHFPHVERLAEVASELIVLERNCTDSLDVPDPACEYVLPSQDYVFITGVTIINKTAPRLFDLTKDAHTVMLGPSVVPSDFLFSWGVDCLAGSSVVDPEKTRRCVEQGAGMIFGQGMRMFRLEKQEDRR